MKEKQKKVQKMVNDGVVADRLCNRESFHHNLKGLYMSFTTT